MSYSRRRASFPANATRLGGGGLQGARPVRVLEDEASRRVPQRKAGDSAFHVCRGRNAASEAEPYTPCTQRIRGRRAADGRTDVTVLSQEARGHRARLDRRDISGVEKEVLNPLEGLPATPRGDVQSELASTEEWSEVLVLCLHAFDARAVLNGIRGLVSADLLDDLGPL